MTNEGGNIFLQPIRLHVSIIQFCGFWFKTSSKTCFFYKLISFCFHFLFTFIFICAMVVNLFTLRSMEEAVQSLYICLTEIAFLYKLVNLWWRNDDVQYLLKLIVQNGNHFDSKEEQSLVEKSAKSFTKRTSIFQIFSILSAIFAFLGPLFAKSYVLPFAAWYPLDWQNNAASYWCLYGYQVIGMSVHCILNVSHDLFVTYVMFVTGLQLDLLNKHLKFTDQTVRVPITRGSLLPSTISSRLSNNRYDCPERSGSKETERYSKELIFWICQHKQINSFILTVQQIFSTPVFIQFIMSGVILCVSAFQLSNISPLQTPEKFLLMSCYISSMLMQLFLPCYFGNEIILSSNKLRTSIYQSNWVLMSKKYKKVMIIFMQKLQNPARIMAGNFFTLSLQTFSSIINSAYSLYAVLKNVENK